IATTVGTRSTPPGASSRRAPTAARAAPLDAHRRNIGSSFSDVNRPDGWDGPAARPILNGRAASDTCGRGGRVIDGESPSAAQRVRAIRSTSRYGLLDPEARICRALRRASKRGISNSRSTVENGFIAVIVELAPEEPPAP